MNLHLLDRIVPNEDLFIKKERDQGQLQQNENGQQPADPKQQKRLQKEAEKARKKAEKAKKKAEKAKQKELKKKAKQQTMGSQQDGQAVNLSQRTDATAEMQTIENQQQNANMETASLSVSTAFLLGGALLLVMASALFYRKKQGQA
ncbi:MAG: hypothetical protein IJ607_03555 [Bacteroidaceae bacterium]|nr:hypothetical protein [Bacteroidaceae bacterium]